MTCYRCSRPAIIYIPGVAEWCVEHGRRIAEFAGHRLQELESRKDSRRPFLQVAA